MDKDQVMSTFDGARHVGGGGYPDSEPGTHSDHSESADPL